MFPPPKATGRPPRNRRDIVEAIFWILRTGAAWRDLPEEYGPWATAWELFDRWNADGTLDAMLDAMRAREIDAERLNGALWCGDGTVVRAARGAAGGGKKRAHRAERPRVGPFSRGIEHQDPPAV